MKRHFYFIILGLFLIVGVEASAQNAAPVSTPPVKDVQKTNPENLQGVPDVAPGYKSDDRSLPDLGRVGVDMADQKPLTLRDAITMALENNKDIEVTRKNVKIAEYDLQAARGVYEPRFSGQTFYERVKTPAFNVFGGAPDGSLTTSNIIGNVGLQTFLPKTGGTINITADHSRADTNNLFSIVDPLTTTTLGVRWTQPLFRGRKFDQNRRTIEIAKKNLSLTDTQFRQRTIDIIANVQRAYWDLTYALRNLQVQRDGVRDAKAQMEHNKRLVEEGQLAPIDVLAAETQVANFEQSVYDALNVVNQAENNLKNLISPNRADRIWSESVTPVDPVDLTVPVTTLGEAMGIALQNRPELEINEKQKEINTLDQRYFRELKKPQIDLVASYSTTGAGGPLNTSAVNPISGSSTANFNTIITRVNEISAMTNPNLPPLPPIVPTVPTLPNTGNAFGNLLTSRYPAFRVGVVFNLPIFGDKTSKAQLGRSLVESERLQTQREQLEQVIQVDVRNALQSVRTAEARLRSAAIARENSVKQYDSEQRKLDAGQSDIYRVLERQTALTTARSSELRAQTELNKAVADLQRATGNSLKANNVEARLKK